MIKKINLLAISNFGNGFRFSVFGLWSPVFDFSLLNIEHFSLAKTEDQRPKTEDCLLSINRKIVEPNRAEKRALISAEGARHAHRYAFGVRRRDEFDFHFLPVA